jgi:glycosyltransferase involved in cell wall biosynthesis
MYKKKILIAPIEIAGYFSNLVQGFNELKIEVTFVKYDEETFSYFYNKKDPVFIFLAKKIKRIRKKLKNIFLSKFLIVFEEILKNTWGLFAIFRYDVFIFGAGRSLLRFNIDLPILKILKKTVISNLGFGSEARPPYISGKNLKFKVNEIKKMKKKVDFHQKYAKIIIGSPSTSHFIKTKFINWFELGFPIDIKCSSNENLEKSKYNINSSSKKVHILHCPSNSISKKTLLIIKAIKNLKKKGHLIDFIIIRRQPTKIVVLEILKSDFIIDELYSDSFMGGIATESSFFGKPIVVCGYNLNYLKKFISVEMCPPINFSHPDHLEKSIEELISNKERRHQLGQRAQDFVRKKYRPVEVAKKYLKLIEGNIPEEWWLFPNKIIYLDGYGISKEQIKKNITDLVGKFGVDVLNLSHHPDLQKAFLDFANIKINNNNYNSHLIKS